MSAVGMPGYQESAADWIPADWSPLPLGAVASVRKDKGVAKQGVPCVELEHVEPETGRLLGWDSSGTQASIKTAFKRGDVLFGKLRPYLRKYAVAPFDGICTTEILAIHPRDGQSDCQFLFHLMQGDGVFATVEALSYGTKMPRVSWTDLSDIVLGIPPLPEQQKIAAILTAVDDKLDVIARQIDATQTLKQGLMQTLFSRGVGTQDADGRWVPHAEFKDSELGEIPVGWEVATLNQCSKVIYRYPGFYGFQPLESGVPVVRGEHIKNGRLSTDWGNYWYITEADSKNFPKTVLEEGDLVMAVRGTVGNFGVVGPEHVGAQISPNLIRISPNEKLVDSKFFFFQMDSSARALQKSYVQSQALPSLSASDIKGIPMPLPPIREQEKIGEILSAVDEKLRHLLDGKSLNEVLKRGLMQKLLTGEWRVNVDASATGA